MKPPFPDKRHAVVGVCDSTTLGVIVIEKIVVLHKAKGCERFVTLPSE